MMKKIMIKQICCIGMLLAGMGITSAYSQGVKIGGQSGVVDPTAVLELESQTQGMLFPRMSQAQRNAIVSPAQGLVLFNTSSNCLQIYIGNVWHDVQCECNAFPDATLSGPVTWYSNLQASFSANQQGLSYAWTFAGGSPSTSTSASPSVTWAAPGTYQVKLTVTDVSGCSDSSTTSVTISSAPPANCLAILQAAPGSPSGVYVIDPDGSGPTAPFSCYCDMQTDGGGWTLVVLTNRNVPGHPNVPMQDAKFTPVNTNGGSVSANLDGYDLWVGTSFWNQLGTQGQMLWKVGTSSTGIQDIVKSTFNIYGNHDRCAFGSYQALQGGIPNIDYNSNGYLQATTSSAGGGSCTIEQNSGAGLYGPWFYQNCSNVSPWCTGHSDCTGQPVSMQWRNQSSYTTGTAGSCAAHGEIYVR